MINDSQIEFQFMQYFSFENEGITSQHCPYENLVSTISALNRCSEKYSVVVKIVPSHRSNQIGNSKSSLEAMKAGFTKREMEVYALAIKGLSNKLIAERLFITSETVKSHRRSIIRKAGVSKIDDIKNLILQVNKVLE